MKNLWNWLNGKKTTIAAIIMMISAFLTEIVVNKWGITIAWIPKLIDILNYFGGILAGVGLIS